MIVENKQYTKHYATASHIRPVEEHAPIRIRKKKTLLEAAQETLRAIEEHSLIIANTPLEKSYCELKKAIARGEDPSKYERYMHHLFGELHAHHKK
jgi:hypothetical protein